MNTSEPQAALERLLTSFQTMTFELGHGVKDCLSAYASICPRILIVGGGRWARVVASVLEPLLPEQQSISFLTRNGARSLQEWADSRGRRIHLFDQPPDVSNFKAAIVVNAARHHVAAAKWCISQGLPTLVEKPLAITGAGAETLRILSEEFPGRLGASQIFLFSLGFRAFRNLVLGSGPIRAAHFEWADPTVEVRHGEAKTFDSSLPVFADCLPHMTAMLSAILPSAPDFRAINNLRGGGSGCDLDLRWGDVICTLSVDRNSSERRRRLTVQSDKRVLEFDFSSEPEKILRDGQPICFLQESETVSPLQLMLCAFLRSVENGKMEAELSPTIGLLTSHLLDEINPEYNRLQSEWLRSKLSKKLPDWTEMDYALREIVQKQSRLPFDRLSAIIEQVRKKYTASEREAFLNHVAATQDVSRFFAKSFDLEENESSWDRPDCSLWTDI